VFTKLCKHFYQTYVEFVLQNVFNINIFSKPFCLHWTINWTIKCHILVSCLHVWSDSHLAIRSLQYCCSHPNWLVSSSYHSHVRHSVSVATGLNTHLEQNIELYVGATGKGKFLRPCLEILDVQHGGWEELLQRT